jgi:hypothetical protein
VGNTKYRAVREEYRGCIYRLIFQCYGSVATLYVRTFGDPLYLSAGVRAQVRELDPFCFYSPAYNHALPRCPP